MEHQARRIAAIPMKRVSIGAAAFLDRQELQALLAQPRTDTSDGIRDLAILIFLYNTGARASEAADARLSGFNFPNRTVTLMGKGRKQRTNPLWPSTVRLLQLYAEHHRRKPQPGSFDHFFINRHGRAFNRFGIRAVVKRFIKTAAKKCPSLAAKRLSTHSLRHTLAVHLLEARVDPNVLKGLLGHASISAGDHYRDTDLNHKRRILEQFGPPHYVNELDNPKPAASGTDLLDWLGDL
jgi:site-specific recombinase XerD